MSKIKEHYKVLVLIVVGVCAYVALNYFFIVAPFIPGLGILVMWSFVLPITSIVITWKYLKSKQQEVNYWETLASLLSLFFVGSGIFTFYIIGQMWAAV